jgi:dTDP-4-amino-4,6-dideoxygalactose transaminase
MKDYKVFIDFVRDLYKMPEAYIPLHEPRFRGNEKKYLNECIDSTFVSSVGIFVDQFEIEIANYTGAAKAVSVVNGTNALHLALKLVGVDQGDEVITQPLTFIATANAISYCGAKPVFIDVDMDTMGLSPKALKKWLGENVEMKKIELKAKAEAKFSQPQPEPEPHFQAYNKNTGNRISACVPMHTFGHPCRIDELVEICNQYNIELVEDAAESLGSVYKGQHTGTFGKIGVLSFNGNKVITTGGGGMLLFKDEKLAQKAKHLTTQAKVPHPWEFVHNEIGYNYRMPNINAALGLAQLEYLEDMLTSKRKIANAYKEYFSNSALASTFNFFTEPENSTSNYWLNILILKDRQEKDAFLKFTNENSVMTRPIWELMNRLPMFKDCQKGELSNAEWLVDRVVNIPSSSK